MDDRLPVGISSCLLGRAVRYDGGHKHAPLIETALGPHVAWIPVCPELEVGLGVPRPPIRLEGDPASPRLVMIDARRDLTAVMTDYADDRIGTLLGEGLCGFILKKDSPSCGVSGVPVHQGDAVGGRASGLFAGLLRARCPDLPVVEEDGLAGEAACRAFLERMRAYRSSRTGDR